MRLSIAFSSISNKFGDDNTIEIAKAAGFDALDFSYYSAHETEDVLGDGYREYAKEMRKRFERAGMVCNQAHAPFSLKYGGTFDTSDINYLHIVRAIESASILGAENIIVHSITTPYDVDIEEYNIAYFKTLVPYCEKFKIHIAIENLFIRDPKRKRLIGKFGSPKELNGLIDKIGSPWIVGCIDVGHSAIGGCEPEYFISELKPEYLRALHIQDNDYLGDNHNLPFVGMLDWEAIMKALKTAGYKGDLTFEIGSYTDKFPKELFPEMLKFIASVGRYLISLYEK